MGNQNSGPRKQPSSLRILRGNPSRGRVIPDLKPPPGDVVKPDRLSPGASAMWDELAPLCLQMGTLTPGDVRPFVALCELQATFIANTAVKGTPAFDVKLEMDLANRMRPFFEYFGMTMYSRAKLAQPKAAAEPVAKWAGQLK